MKQGWGPSDTRTRDAIWIAITATVYACALAFAFWWGAS